jgi:hypothetical protein
MGIQAYLLLALAVVLVIGIIKKLWGLVKFLAIAFIIAAALHYFGIF